MNEGMNVRKILSAVGVVCCGRPWEGDVGRTRCKERVVGCVILSECGEKFLRAPLSVEILYSFNTECVKFRRRFGRIYE
jgi:hypothetical protein